MNRLSLKFLSNDSRAELFESEFTCALVGRTLRCARGRQAFNDSVEGTFLWSSAVQSMCAVVIKSKIASLTRTGPNAWSEAAGLSSDSTSWALSLDFALSKKPRWLLDMFGVDSGGAPITKRLFVRMNPEKKRQGPCWVSLNPAFLQPENIQIFLDGTEVQDAVILKALLPRIGLEDQGQGINIQKQIVPDGVSLRSLSAANGDAIQLPNERNGRSAVELSLRGKELDVSVGTAQRKCDASQSFLSGTMFGDPWWMDALKVILREEISTMLADCSIFRSETLQGEISSMCKSASYRAIAAKNLALISDIDLSLGSSARLGVIERDLCRRQVETLGRPLSIALPITLAPSLALLSYLQSEHEVPLDVNYRYAHSLEIIGALDNSRLSSPPDGIVMGVVPAVTYLSQRRRPPYKPLMIMPKASNRIVASREARVSKATRFVLPSDLPTSASFILDSMVASGRLTRSSTKIEHLEPDEIVSKIQKSSDDFRSILWFPHYQLNRLLHGCQLSAPESRAHDLPTILLVHEKIMCNVALVTAFDVAVRDAWLTLRLGGARLTRVIERLVSDTEYLELFTRYTGLYAFDQDFFQKAKEALHACG